VKRRHVVVTETAHQHIRSARAWWLENNLDLNIFLSEVEDAIALLSLLPGAGTAYDLAGIAGLRRIYLRHLMSHLYYTFDDNVVVVHALWHARREHGPG